MARSWRIRYAGAKYHVTVRGNARQEVFHSDGYYGRFIEQLMEGLEKDQVILLRVQREWFGTETAAETEGIACRRWRIAAENDGFDKDSGKSLISLFSV